MDFIAFGVPKSGTTWLQMLLNSHPCVSCRPEDQLMYFIRPFAQIAAEYSQLIKNVQERTAKQDTMSLEDDFVVQLFKTSGNFLAGQQKTKQICGINDNAVLEVPALYFNSFSAAKFIHIIRDPRALAVSSWYHNMRVEPGFIGRANSLEEWCAKIAAEWTRAIIIDEAHKDKLNWVSIKYEDLCADTPGELGKLFKFLGANEGPAAQCAKACQFSKMKLSGNEFYRQGGSGGWETELDNEMIDQIESIAGESMEKYGYINHGGGGKSRLGAI